ncbi:ABC transporter ATP-binding protein [Actinotalea sp. BY-33]|uniref:ABC transporter ATP-binding protein n=1 Tax=Actinotalea soli TaxID=2819234 RepID=A0A939LQL1_9CELL|nr:ABC transporter ATP-binding protein [Actinotalea soli]MBO1751190.1 ABC transporter ATP-binding protein [Actinotalea soli]
MSAIEMHDLHKTYRSTTAVAGVSLTVPEGSIMGLVGRNGAGKTTTVEITAGLREPDRGRVSVLGLDPRRDRRAVRQVLGVQLQESQLHSALTALELVTLYRSLYRSGLGPAAALEAVGLGRSAGTRFEKLSGGQQQRLSIALAIIGRPRVVILDELTTGLDPEARREVWGLVDGLRADGVTVLLVSHHMDEVERLCDQVALLDAGRVASTGSPATIVARAALPQRVRFDAEHGLDAALLRALPEVEEVEVRGRGVVVRGRGDLERAVSTSLTRHGVVVTGASVERPTLEDAFLALTGRQAGPDTEVDR